MYPISPGIGGNATYLSAEQIWYVPVSIRDVKHVDARHHLEKLAEDMGRGRPSPGRATTRLRGVSGACRLGGILDRIRDMKCRWGPAETGGRSRNCAYTYYSNPDHPGTGRGHLLLGPKQGRRLVAA